MASREADSRTDQRHGKALSPKKCVGDVLHEIDERASLPLGWPFELEDELLLPQYGLSRLLDRIERAGYIERRPRNDDGRGQLVAITEAGISMRRRMWPVYARTIQGAVGAHLTGREAKQLADRLGKLIAR